MAQNNHPQRYQRKQSADEIGMIEDVLRLYNTVAEPFMDAKNALTQQTKYEMLQRIRKIQPSISSIVNGLARIWAIIIVIEIHRQEEMKSEVST